MPSARQIGYHLPYREVPAAYRDRPVLGTVRSPWAYYVSWYHFQISRPKPNVLFRLCSDDRRLGFADTVSRLIDLAADEVRLSFLREALPDTYGPAGLNLTKGCIVELKERGLGFYSFLYERLYAGAEEPRILRVESLRYELLDTLKSWDLLPNFCAEQYLAEAPPRNVSQHDTPASYYDERLAMLVAERDRTIVDRHGYVFGAEA